MNHDAAHKYIYSLPEVTADLLRLVAPDLVDELDLLTLEDRSSEYLDAAHRKRQGDMVWRVCFRKGRADSGDRPFLLVLVEFQSTVDRRMDERVREYTKMLLGRSRRPRRMTCCRGCWMNSPASPARGTRRSGGRCMLGRERCGRTRPAARWTFRPLRNLSGQKERA